MNVTPRVIEFLKLLRRYKYVTTAQLRDWIVPHDKDGSITREVLRKMRSAGLAHRYKAEIHDPLRTPSVPVWSPTEAGCCLLASKTGDASFLLDGLPYSRNWNSFPHYTCVTHVAHHFDMAFAAQTYARLGALYFEHDVISDAEEPEKKFRLYTIVSDAAGKRTVCIPDFALEIVVNDYRRVYYGELERGSDSPKRVAAKKSPGYAGMNKHFRKHFPQAQDWRVLFIWPNAGLRDAARKAVDPLLSENWLFVAFPEIQGMFLHEPIIYGSQDGPKPLIKPPPTPPGTTLPREQTE